jgi:hypothetical protein
MKRCELKNPNARKTLADVWRHLRARFPADARFLSAIITRMEPLTDGEAEDGTRGWWIPDGTGTNFPLGSAEMHAWYNRLDRFFDGTDHGKGYGMMKLPDDDALTAGVVAHEMGHAFASDEDETERRAPDSEWASEATADMHATRWGLLTLDDIRNRHAANVAAVDGAAWVHHGPPPGGGW